MYFVSFDAIRSTHTLTDSVVFVAQPRESQINLKTSMEQTRTTLIFGTDRSFLQSVALRASQGSPPSPYQDRKAVHQDRKRWSHQKAPTSILSGPLHQRLVSVISAHRNSYQEVPSSSLRPTRSLLLPM